jgi:hypothetical protein
MAAATALAAKPDFITLDTGRKPPIDTGDSPCERPHRYLSSSALFDFLQLYRQYRRERRRYR